MWGKIYRFFVDRPVNRKAPVFACPVCGDFAYGPCSNECAETDELRKRAW